MDRSGPAATPACRAGARRAPGVPDWPLLRVPEDIAADLEPVDLGRGANSQSGNRSARRQNAELPRKQNRRPAPVRRAAVMPAATAHPVQARGPTTRFAVLRERFRSSLLNVSTVHRLVVSVSFILEPPCCALPCC